MNKESPNMEPQVKQPWSAGNVQYGKHNSRAASHHEKLLMEPLAIPLGSQIAATKRLVMSGHPKEEK